MLMVMSMVKKTTVLLRDYVYQALKEKAGTKNISNLIKKIVIEYLMEEESMLGTMRKADISDLRDHRERL